MKRIFIAFMSIVVPFLLQATELGVETRVDDFGAPLKSGFYENGSSSTLPGGFPDTSHPWIHLITSRHSNGTNNYQFQIASSYSTSGGVDRAFFRKIALGSYDASNPNWNEFATRGSNTFLGDQIFSSGDVGIGTSDPRKYLSTDRALTISADRPGIELYGNATTYNEAIATFSFFNDVSSHPDNRVAAIDIVNDNHNDRGKFHFYTRNEIDGWHLGLVQNSLGDVGIGTTSPNYKLDVNGTIRAKEVIVETNWSDFVFENDYKLRPLAEVSTFISEHGHLPDVPSAETVQSQGLSVGESQAIMMQKIEELTLYTLQQNEQLSEQNERFHQQQQLIEQLLAANVAQQSQIETLSTQITDEIE